MNELRTVRGMRDLMGREMRIRNYLVSTCVDVFQLFGFEPLDSPAMELWETLSAKGGEEVEEEAFKFTDKGDREVGLRFDLTVPLARIVAGNPHLSKPFKRYAVGKAWRYDRPQAGRYREFMQADVDIIGSSSPVADAEVVVIALEILDRILKSDFRIRINNRKVLKGLVEVAGVREELSFECFRAIDKLDKIGVDGVIKELEERGINSDSSEILLDAIMIRGFGEDALAKFEELLKSSSIGMEGLSELRIMSSIFERSGVQDFVEFDMSLARGLDYYTGPVFEGQYLGKPYVGSILGGGRYDKLIERFGGSPTPATGISIGIDRLIDVLMPRNLDDLIGQTLDVFIAPINSPMAEYAMALQRLLARKGISSEVDLMDRPLGKLLELADERGAKFTVIVGERDMKKNQVSVRNMSTKSTEQVNFDDTSQYLEKIIRS